MRPTRTVITLLGTLISTAAALVLTLGVASVATAGEPTDPGNRGWITPIGQDVG